MVLMKMQFRAATAVFSAAVLFSQPAFPQQAAQAKSDEPVISSTSQEVLLDVVVRDKKGKLVKDLEEKDFQVSDDGHPEKIRAFRLVSGNEPDAAPLPGGTKPAAPRAPASASVDPLRQVRVVTLAFTGMDTEARNNARKAAEDLLASEAGPNLFFGVFSMDQRLSVLQQYTTDRDLVKQAVVKATTPSSTLYKGESDRIEEELKTLATQGSANTAAATNANGAPDAVGSASAALAQMTLQAMQFQQTLDRTLQGRATIYTLKALIQEQFRLPGRKTLIYFTGGLQIPPEYKYDFDALISSANRANVAVYGIDARGLNTNTQNQEAAALLSQSAASSRNMQTKRSGPVTRDEATAGDRADEAIRANTQNSLAELSEKTGGFAVLNTNDFRSPLRRIGEEIDTHYELAYSPDIEKFDGHFRTISVKVARADAKVQTRSGYFALPFTNGHTVAPYELSMLNALTKTPMPKDIPFHSAALHFRSPQGGPESAVVMDVPLDAVQFTPNQAEKNWKLHFSVMAVYKDSKGEVVKSVSQDVPRQGPLDRIEGFRQGHFIYTQKVDLPPGRYTLETAVFDGEANKVGAKKAVAMIPASSASLGISSLAFVRSVAPAQTGPMSAQSADDPFEFSGGKVTPSLTDTFKGGPGSALSLYFTAYTQPGATASPDLTIEFVQDGKLLGKGQPKLPAPDSAGRIPYIASSPLDAFKPGQYEVRATVSQNGATATERVFFNVE